LLKVYTFFFKEQQLIQVIIISALPTIHNIYILRNFYYFIVL